MSKNGKSRLVKKVARGRKQAPIDYKLSVSFEIEQSPELGGMSMGGSMTVPIRRGAGARLAKYKKEDVAAVFRQLADVVERGDYSAMGPDFGAAIKAGMEASKSKKTAN